MLLLRRIAILTLVLCQACWAESVSPVLQQRIEAQVRAHYSVSPRVDIAVGSPSPSEFVEYDKLTVTLSREGKTQKINFLLSRDGKTLVHMSTIDLTRDPFAEAMGQIDIAGRPVRGNPDAKITIVNYDDFECPFCARLHATLMTEIMAKYGDRVRIVYKDYPLPGHVWAPHAANDANCLAKESPAAYWDLADYIHASLRTINGDSQDPKKTYAELDRITMDFGKKHGADSNRLRACILAPHEEIVKASVAEGDKMGVSATPTMFINGGKLEGLSDEGEVRAAIDDRLRAAGVQPPPPDKSEQRAANKQRVPGSGDR